MPEGAEVDYIQAQESLTNDELIALLKEVFIPLGFKKFRLTGGEPLLRRDLVSLVEAISNLGYDINNASLVSPAGINHTFS